MKYYIFAILFSTFFSLQDLKAIPSKDDGSSSYSELQDAPPNTPRKASSAESIEEVEIDIEQGTHTKKKKIKGDEKKRQSLEEFEEKYFERMGKFFFIIQRLSRFTNFGALTISAGLSAYTLWVDKQLDQNSTDCSGSNSSTTGLNSTVLVLSLISIGAAAADLYATNFLSEAKKKEEDN